MCGSPCTSVRGPRVPQLHDSSVSREVDVGEPVELVVQLVAERVDRHLHERRAAAPAARALRREPREIAAVVEAWRLPERARAARRAARRCRGRGTAMSASFGSREAAPAGHEVFEHHHVAVAVGRRRTRRSARAPALRARGRGRSAASATPMPPWSTNSRCASSNGGSFTNTRRRDAGSRRAARRAPVRSFPTAVEHVAVGRRRVERVREPLRREVVDVERRPRGEWSSTDHTDEDSVYDQAMVPTVDTLRPRRLRRRPAARGVRASCAARSPCTGRTMPGEPGLLGGARTPTSCTSPASRSCSPRARAGSCSRTSTPSSWR